MSLSRNEVFEGEQLYLYEEITNDKLLPIPYAKIETELPEGLSFILLDLIRLSADSPVICDCHIDMTMADLLTDPSRLAFMIREPVNIADEYCARADHADFDSFLHSASDPEKAKALVNRTLYTLNADHYAAVKRSRYMWIDRSEGFTPEECARRTAVHFGWETA